MDQEQHTHAVFGGCIGRVTLFCCVPFLIHTSIRSHVLGSPPPFPQRPQQLLVYLGQADVASMTAVTGGISVMPLADVLPPLSYNAVFADTITPTRRRVHQGLALLGGCLGLLAAVEALRTWGSAVNFNIQCSPK
jgi:hypothetical protein